MVLSTVIGYWYQYHFTAKFTVGARIRIAPDHQAACTVNALFILILTNGCACLALICLYFISGAHHAIGDMGLSFAELQGLLAMCSNRATNA